ncbi:MAG: hypothetical protein K0R80_368 [Clostridia bacterium]|jgi:predicted esterase|nr:hypothetical protein [Clostridia bacterium]
MHNKDFMQLDKRLTILWGEGKLKEAIMLLEESIGQYPENTASMNLDLAFFYLGVDNIEKCLEILNKAIEEGIWYPKAYFTKHKDDERFKRIFEKWDKISEEDIRNSKPYWKICTPAAYTKENKYPLFVAIHGWGEDVDMFESYWQSLKLSEQYLLAMPQSSQIMGTSKYAWNDNEKSHKELASMYQHILGNYNVDTNAIIVGGFSQGATLAIDLTFNCTYMPIKGFIALNPDKPTELSEDNITSAKEKGIKGHIITGDKDQSYGQQRDMMDTFHRLGFSCQMDVIEGWGHWFPEDLSQRIDKALDDINS